MNFQLYQLPPKIRNQFSNKGFSNVGALSFQKMQPTVENFRSISADLDDLDFWLQSQFNADMSYISKNRTALGSPDMILEGAQGVIVAVMPYAHGKSVRKRGDWIHETQSVHLVQGRQVSKDVVEPENGVETGRRTFLELTARYAQGKDYHKELKKQFTSICASLFSSEDFRVVVDTAPFLERAYARICGLGFVGKNTMLISPGVGSYFFISSCLLTTPLISIGATPIDVHESMARLSCGACTKCIDACPTQALGPSYVLDANRCLSYLSIEHRDVVSPQFLKHFRDNVYGCDICQDVCPYNLKTLGLHESNPFLSQHHPLKDISVFEVASMDNATYQRLFGGTALTRAKYGGLVRNALYHLFATRHPHLEKLLENRKSDSVKLISDTVQQILSLLVNSNL